ncbi:hypothetical protein [Aliamphritea spongicola]|nr:hypothetical protein [Aliamphritea spongicola]
MLGIEGTPQLTATLDAGLDIAQLLSDYDHNRELSSFAANSIIAGGIVSTAITLVGAFSEPKATTDQLILENIASLSRQIESFRVEVHNRFNYIDDRLNNILMMTSKTF